MVAIMISTVSATAQDASAPPSQGSLALSAGFEPDPAIVSFQSTGAGRDAADLSASCDGNIETPADVHLDYSASATAPLVISVASSADTSLLVKAPNGAWYCDDDGGIAAGNPSLRFGRPQSGRYAIWVGSNGVTAVELTVSSTTSR